MIVMSKIELIIAEIEDYIAGCRFQTFSRTNIIVNKDEIEELVALLRLRVPDEIKKYNKIIANRDLIIEDANKKADEIIQNAKTMANGLVSEHQIIHQAYIQATEIVQKAKNDAQQIVENAAKKE